MAQRLLRIAVGICRLRQNVVRLWQAGIGCGQIAYQFIDGCLVRMPGAQLIELHQYRLRAALRGG